MAKKGNKYKVGLLTIIFIVLLVIVLMSLGIMKYFQPKIPFMTATTESVQGLSRGAKVKIKGVTVGMVSNIQLGMKGQFIYIFMEFDPTSFLKQSDMKMSIKEMKKFFRSNLEQQIKEGLRCQLQYEGITGSMYVEIRRFDLNKYKDTDKVQLPLDHPLFLPSIPQASIGNMLEDAQLALKKIGEVDFEKISNQLESLLTTTNDMIGSNKVEKIITEVGDISNNLKDMTNSFNAVINEDRITDMTNNIKAAVTDFRLLTSETRKNLKQSNIPGIINSTKSLIRNLNLLIKYLDMNPDALIRGRNGESIVPPFSSDIK